MNIIKAEKINHSYIISGRRNRSLKDISFEIEKGEFVGIIGKNGCGKSTLAKHINALLPLQSGNLTVAKLSVNDKKSIIKIRKSCGMVFQNPDNQFVSSIVEEDIKFGLRNFNLMADDEAVRKALSLVKLSGFEKRDISTLSGGQKQRAALAAILAIKPDIIILDEATSMLPPEGRKEIIEIIKSLHQSTNTTFIIITQYVEEVAEADRIIVMDSGKIIAGGLPAEILSNRELMQKAGLKPPFAVNVYYDLKAHGISLSECPLTNERLVDLLCRLK